MPEAKSAGTANPPQPVQVMTVVLERGGQTWNYTGVIRPRFESDLGFRVSGKIVSREVDVGQKVVAGQLLARLDDTDLRLALEAQAAELRAAQTSRDQAVAAEGRFDALFQKGHVSQAALDQRRSAAEEARSRVDKAERNLAIARNQLSYARLEAQSAGVVSAITAEIGQVMAAGQAVVRVARLDEVEAVVAVPEQMAAAIGTATAEVSFWAGDGVRHPARLRELSPEADKVTRTYQARYSLPAAVGAVAQAELGRTATIHFSRGAGDMVALLPLSAVMNDGRSAHVYVVDGSGTQARRTPVTISALTDSQAIVSGGIRAGDQVVTLGVHRLDEGRPVKVVQTRAEVVSAAR
jgi:RND family efflux transporter MFP subunit